MKKRISPLVGDWLSTSHTQKDQVLASHHTFCNLQNNTYRNTRVKSEKMVTKFGESLNLVMFLVNISVRNWVNHQIQWVFWGLFWWHIQRVTQFGEKISNKICELLSERKCEQFHDPFGVVFSDFFSDHFFWWVYLSIFGICPI